MISGQTGGWVIGKEPVEMFEGRMDTREVGKWMRCDEENILYSIISFSLTFVFWSKRTYAFDVCWLVGWFSDAFLLPDIPSVCMLCITKLIFGV